MEGFRKFRDSCMLSPQDALRLQSANGEQCFCLLTTTKFLHMRTCTCLCHNNV
jgi:hypothetical protein